MLGFLIEKLAEKSNVQKMHFSHSDKPIKFYNLNVIISVGYIVNSIKATLVNLSLKRAS
jgi:hypothetical protein